MNLDIELCRLLLRAETREAKAGSLLFEFNEKQNEQMRDAIALLLNEKMGFPTIERNARISDVKLRIAMHLSPAQAINYDSNSDVSRWELIAQHVEKEFGVISTESEAVGRSVAVVLDSWDSARNPSSRYKNHCLDRQGKKCASCYVPLTPFRHDQEVEKEASGKDDPMKPYLESGDDWLTADVDHIEAISKEGTNDPQNLQVLCKLCNKGKSNGNGVSAARERKYAASLPRDMSRTHRAALLYYRIKLDEGMCSVCKSQVDELTVRKIKQSGAFVLTNLTSLCYPCAEK